MVCPRCGQSVPASAGRCQACGAAFAQTSVATGVIPIDTTGLPPGATFGASAGLRTAGETAGATAGATGDAATDGAAADATSHADGPLKVGQSFGPRYHIIKLLGAGGMGAVYQAWDAELGVAVALKVIRTDRRRGSASPEAEKRFKNELLLARQVTHKNVVRIHDLGEIDGVKYITMPYVQGDDLASVLRRDGKLPIARALRLARQVAGGLEAAHEAGVVHRDLKPPNIMIGAAGDDEQALIMDFGISASADAVTEGTVVGTLEYMSPEQATGRAVDARSDLYAFGLILHEMLVGPRSDPPRTAQDRVAAMRQRFEQGLPFLRTVDESIPEPLAAVVSRCLEGDPAARYQTTAELTAALAALDDAGELIPEPTRLSKRMLAATLVVVLALLAGTYVVGRRAVPPPPVKHPLVPVLIGDFDNQTGDPVFHGTLEQTLAIALESASYVSVFPRKDAQALAAQLEPGRGDRISNETAQLIARREGLKVVVAGAIHRRGNGFRVSINATDPATGKSVASATEDAKDDSQVLRAVGVLAARVRVALGESKTDMDKVIAAETFTAASLDAMRAYARGQELTNAGDVDAALAAYREAVARDPQLGRAYAGMAAIYRNLGRMDDAEASFREALKYLDRMTEREKYRTLGTYYIAAARNYEKAVETFDALVARYPFDQGGLTNLALANVFVHNFGRAVSVSKQLIDTYPNNVVARNNYVAYALYAGDFETAIAQGNLVLKANPRYQFAFLPLALAHALHGDTKTGLAIYGQLEKLNAFGTSLGRLGEADVAMYEGRYKDAVRLLSPAIAADEREGNKAAAAAKDVALAEAQMALGRRGPAITAAQRAAALGEDQSTLFPVALVLVEAGQETAARDIAAKLDAMLQNQPRAYARLIAAEIARRQHRIGDAVDAYREAQKRDDSWWSRFGLGRTYAEAGHHDAEAIAELELAVKRRGEGADAFIADTPTLRYVPAAYYWLARAHEAVSSTVAARANFEQFLILRGAADPPDPLVADARARIGR